MEAQANNRLQPCLLDRLLDDQPDKPDESRSDRVVSLARYREAVLRDLGWLFNCTAHIEGDPLYDNPGLRSCVLNFGVRDLSGLVSDSVDLEHYRRQIVETLFAFEPRLNRSKLDVRFTSPTSVGRGRARSAAPLGVLCFEISGELFARPFPERFFARTEIDLETGASVLSTSSSALFR